MQKELVFSSFGASAMAEAILIGWLGRFNFIVAKCKPVGSEIDSEIEPEAKCS